MPKPGKKETEQQFINRCIPMAINDKIAQDNKQAYAICKTIWDAEKNKKKIYGVD